MPRITPEDLKETSRNIEPKIKIAMQSSRSLAIQDESAKRIHEYNVNEEKIQQIKKELLSIDNQLILSKNKLEVKKTLTKRRIKLAQELNALERTNNQEMGAILEAKFHATVLNAAKNIYREVQQFYAWRNEKAPSIYELLQRTIKNGNTNKY